MIRPVDLRTSCDHERDNRHLIGLWLTTSRIGNLIRLILTLATVHVITNIYIDTYIHT